MAEQINIKENLVATLEAIFHSLSASADKKRIGNLLIVIKDSPIADEKSNYDNNISALINLLLTKMPRIAENSENKTSIENLLVQCIYASAQLTEEFSSMSRNDIRLALGLPEEQSKRARPNHF